MHLYNVTKYKKKYKKNKKLKIKKNIGYYYKSKILNNDKISDKIIINKS